MGYNNSCVEAILRPNSTDFGFFNYFYRLLQERHPEIKGTVDNKQKSIVMTSDTMYVCQFVKMHSAIYQRIEPMESIISVNLNSGRINLMEFSIPDTTRHRVATNELWLYLSYGMGLLDEKVFPVISGRLEKSTDVDLFVNIFDNTIRKVNSNSKASFQEIVIGLSEELRR